MGVYIPKMEMPEYGCSTCPMCVEADRVEYSIEWKCVLLDKFVVTSSCETDEDCPLIELPPHGRLIDADALMKRCRDYPYGYRGLIEGTVENMPTIIETEESEDAN